MLSQDAIDFFGGVKKLSDALGIWPQAVYKWGETVPDLQAYKIQVLSKNKLMVDDGKNIDI